MVWASLVIDGDFALGLGDGVEAVLGGVSCGSMAAGALGVRVGVGMGVGTRAVLCAGVEPSGAADRAGTAALKLGRLVFGNRGAALARKRIASAGSCAPTRLSRCSTTRSRPTC